MDKVAAEQLIEARQQKLRDLISSVEIDRSFTYNDTALIEQSVRWLADNCTDVLDIGKSSRQFFEIFSSEQVTTLDINQFEDYPDIIDDICDPFHLQDAQYDGLVCLSVIEHVYDPQAAVRTLHRCLKPGGKVFVFVPFLFRYHAPRNLYFQDYYRFTRDGVAWLFRDFDNMTVYPVRGRLSSALNLQRYWKRRVEKRFGHKINRFADRIYDRLTHKSPAELQASGYYVWATKPLTSSESDVAVPSEAVLPLS